MSFSAQYPYTTADLVNDIGLNRKAIRARAAALGLGVNLAGRAGFRYSEADRQKLIESMRPTPATPRRKKRRVA